MQLGTNCRFVRMFKSTVCDRQDLIGVTQIGELELPELTVGKYALMHRLSTLVADTVHHGNLVGLIFSTSEPTTLLKSGSCAIFASTIRTACITVV